MRVDITVHPFIMDGGMVMKEVELTASKSELSHWSWTGLVLMAVQVRVSLVPANTVFSCEAVMLRVYSSSEYSSVHVCKQWFSFAAWVF